MANHPGRNRVRTLSIIVTLGLLVTLYLTGHLWNQIRVERSRLLDLQARMHTAESTAPPPEIAAAPAPVAPPAPAPIRAAATAQPPPTIAASTAPPSGPSATIAIKQALTGSSANSMMRMVLLQLYPDVAAELGLSPEETDRLMDVMARQQAATARDTLGLMNGEIADQESVQTVERRLEDNRRAAEADIATLLGNKYADWQRYQAKSTARLLVTRLQNALGSSNALSEPQSTTLLAAFTDAQVQLNVDRRNKPEFVGLTRQDIMNNQLAQLDASNQRLFDTAAPILTPSQQDVYKRTLDQTTTMMRTTLRAMAGPMDSQGSAH
jgi:hypothetical protein